MHKLHETVHVFSGYIPICESKWFIHYQGLYCGFMGAPGNGKCGNGGKGMDGKAVCEGINPGGGGGSTIELE